MFRTRIPVGFAVGIDTLDYLEGIVGVRLPEIRFVWMIPVLDVDGSSRGAIAFRRKSGEHAVAFNDTQCSAT